MNLFFPAGETTHLQDHLVCDEVISTNNASRLLLREFMLIFKMFSVGLVWFLQCIHGTLLGSHRIIERMEMLISICNTFFQVNFMHLYSHTFISQVKRCATQAKWFGSWVLITALAFLMIGNGRWIFGQVLYNPWPLSAPRVALSICLRMLLRSVSIDMRSYCLPVV